MIRKQKGGKSSMKIEKTILTVSETAFILNCSDHVIYRLIHANALGAYKDIGGRRWRIPECSVTDYVASRMRDSASMR